MHELQRHILKTLMFSKKARYSALKPKEVEGNQFSYHLKSLLNEGYIEQNLLHYTLSPKGRQYVDTISSETLNPRSQPKIVTLIVLKEGDKYLLYKRNKVPFMNLAGFPYGKIHLEERIADAACRELIEKTGLSATLKLRGDIYITVHDETELVSHMLCHIFSGTKVSGDLKGDCFWAPIDQFSPTELMPGVSQILKLLEQNKNSFFFAEYFLNTSEEISS